MRNPTVYLTPYFGDPFAKDTESAQWREKAISCYQEVDGFSDRILELKRPIIWNYIHHGDIPNALDAAAEVDTWLTEVPEGTPRRGQMLHLKARAGI